MLTSSYLEDHWLKVMSLTYDHHMHQNCTYRQYDIILSMNICTGEYYYILLAIAQVSTGGWST